MKIAQRLPVTVWQDPDQFQKILAFLTEHRDAVDEITLFSGDTHDDSPRTLEELREKQALTKSRIRAFHEAGFESVGINVLVTIGHIDENRHGNGLPYQKIVGYKGDVSTGCCCPNNEAFLEYIRQKYTLVAESDPDFIWVDDDIKLFWNGVKFGCFCPDCMRKFNARHGYSFTRETLVAAMEQPDNTLLRGQWVQDVCDRITVLLGEIGKAIRAVKPSIRLGFMTQRQSWSTYNGMDFPAWFTALGAEMGRPGEGYYYDTVPEDVLTKALSTAQQAFAYPKSVTDVQYELENYPGNTWQKSRRINVAELGLAAAQGMNGALLNNMHTILSADWEGGDYDAFAAQKKAWADYLTAGTDYVTSGFYPAFSLKYDARRTLKEGETFFRTLETSPRHDVTGTYAFAKLGVPLTMAPEGAWGVILTGNLHEGYTDEELTELLRKGVLVNGDAVDGLVKRGFGKYLGVRTAGRGGLGLYERANMADPVNAGLENPIRDVHPAFWGGEGIWLEATDEKTRTVSTMEDRGGGTLGIATSLFENELGGRVCVMGYAPFLQPNDCQRFLQLQTIFAWLAGNRQRARLMTPGRIAMFVREGKTGTEAALMNLMLDDAENVTVSVRGAEKAEECTPDGKKPMAVRENGGWGEVTFPRLEPYTVHFLVTDGK